MKKRLKKKLEKRFNLKTYKEYKKLKSLRGHILEDEILAPAHIYQDNVWTSVLTSKTIISSHLINQLNPVKGDGSDVIYLNNEVDNETR